MRVYECEGESKLTSCALVRPEPTSDSVGLTTPPGLGKPPKLNTGVSTILDTAEVGVTGHCSNLSISTVFLIVDRVTESGGRGVVLTLMKGWSSGRGGRDVVLTLMKGWSSGRGERSTKCVRGE